MSHLVAMGVGIGGLKISGTLVLRSLSIRSVLDSLKRAPPHMCYHAQFRRSRSNGTNVRMENPGKSGFLE